MMTFTLPSRRGPACLRALCAGGVIGMLAAAGAARAADVKPMLLLDERLELSPIQVTDVSQTALEHIDHRGQARTRPIDRSLALLPRSFDPASGASDGAAQVLDVARAQPGATAAAARPWITLVDGQRIVGAPDVEAAQEDALAWRHESLGTLVFRLERISRIVFAPEAEQPASATAPAGANDLVVLRNGDRLTGFIVAVQPDVEIESGNQTITIPADRVARVELVNPPEAARGTHLWLTDGTRIGVHSLAGPDEESAGGALTLHIEPPSESPLSEIRTIPLHQVSALAFDAGRLMALSDLAIERHEPAEARRMSRPPVAQRQHAAPLGAGDIVLPGPMTVEWTLPEGAARLAGWVTLPESSFTWGDCRLIIETIDEDGRVAEAAQARLRGMTPIVRINEPLPDGAERLRMRLEPGEYGPVQDTLVLERFILLLSPR